MPTSTRFAPGLAALRRYNIADARADLRAGLAVAAVALPERFIKLVSRPRVEILGKVEGFPGFHSLSRHESGQRLPGLLLFRFNAPITFFNSLYFKRELLSAVDEAGPDLRHVVIDLLPVSSIDATGLMTITDLTAALGARGIGLNAAGRLTEWDNWAAERGLGGSGIGVFPTLRQAVRKLSATTHS